MKIFKIILSSLILLIAFIAVPYIKFSLIESCAIQAEICFNENETRRLNREPLVIGCGTTQICSEGPNLDEFRSSAPLYWKGIPFPFTLYQSQDPLFWTFLLLNTVFFIGISFFFSKIHFFKRK